MPAADRATSTVSMRLSITLATSQYSSCVRVCWYSESIGTRAASVAPSPIMSLSMLGRRNATTKAWANMLVPNSLAKSMSLMNPSTRLVAVARLMMPVDFMSLWLVVMGRSIIAQ